MKVIDRINNRTKLYFSKQAGSFSDVPQRTVQSWTENNLISPAEQTPGGTGRRRKYNALNCIQIAIIKALTDGRVRISTVHGIMQHLNGLGGLRLPTLFSHDQAFLIIRFASRKSEKPYTILYEYFNEDARPAQMNTLGTLVFNPDIEKTLIVNIAKIAEMTLDRME